MTSIFEKIQKECQNKTEYKKLSEFEIGVYPITEFKFTRSNFGEGRRLSIIMPIKSDTTTIVHLPDRFLNVVNTDEEIKELNCKKYNLNYMGMDPKQKNKYLFNLDEVTIVSSATS